MYNALDRKGKKTVTAAVYQKLVKAEDEIFDLVYKNNHKKLQDHILLITTDMMLA